MPTRTVDVIARFRADTKAMRAGMGGLVTVADTLINKAKWAGLAFGAGLTYAAKKVVTLQSEMESARMGMATMFQNAAKAPISFGNALGEADNMIEKLRKDAALLPGTFDEMQASFSTLLPVLARAGSDLDQIRKIAGQTVVASKLGGGVLGGANTVARDIAQILGGSADERTTQTQAFKGHIAELKKLALQSQAKAVSEMERLLTVSDEALGAYAQTWDAQFSTAVDTAKEFARMATKPLFQAATKKFGELNEWLAANKDLVVQTAQEWGSNLLESIKETAKWVKDDLWPFMKRVVSLVETLADHWKTIAVTIAGIKIADWLSKITHGIATLNPAIAAMAGATASLTLAAETWSESAKLMKEDKGFREQLFGMSQDTRRSKKVSGEAFQSLLSDADFKAFVRKQVASKLYNKYQSAIINYASAANNGAAEKWAQADRIRRMDPVQALQLMNATQIMGQLVGEFKREFKPKLGPAPPPEMPVAPLELKPGDTKPPVIDARGSNFYLDMSIEDGDPDRIALELPHSLYSAFRPTLPGTVPAL